MATLTNIKIQLLSGTIGKQLVVKQYVDKTVVSKYPDMSRVKARERQKQK